MDFFYWLGHIEHYDVTGYVFWLALLAVLLSTANMILTVKMSSRFLKQKGYPKHSKKGKVAKTPETAIVIAKGPAKPKHTWFRRWRKKNEEKPKIDEQPPEEENELKVF